MKNHNDLLIKDENDFLKKIEELEEIYFLRKHDHTLSAKYNSTFKQKYNALKEKAKRLKDEEKISQKILKDKSLYENLKNENFELNRKIQEMKSKNAYFLFLLPKLITFLHNHLNKYYSMRI